MPTKDDPLGLFDPITDFESEEEAAAYDKWFREQVEASLASTKPTIPHEVVVRQLRELLVRKRREHAARDGES